MNELIKTEKGYEIDGVQVISTSLVAKEFEREHRDVIHRVTEAIEKEDVCFELNKHYFVLEKAYVQNTHIELFSGSNRQQEVYLLTERGFNKIVMGWRGKKADVIKEHILDVYFKAKEIHNQGISSEYLAGLAVGEVKEQINYLTNTISELTDSVNSLKMSELDMFATEDGGYYRKQINKLVRKRSRDKKEKIVTTWFNLYKAFKSKTGLDPFTMADSVGITKMDWIATKGRLKTLHEVAVKLCADRVWDESANSFGYDIPEDTPLDEV